MNESLFEFLENVIRFSPYLTDDGRWIICANMKGSRTFRKISWMKNITCTEVVFDSNDYESRDAAIVRAAEYNKMVEFVKCAISACDIWNNTYGKSIATEDGCATVL